MAKQRKLNKSLKRLLEKGKYLYKQAKVEIKKSIKLQILFAVGTALTFSVLSSVFVSEAIRHTDLGRKKYTAYEESKASFENYIISILTELNKLEDNVPESKNDISFEEETIESEFKENLSQLTDNYYGAIDTNYYLADSKGTIIFQKDYVQSIDLVKVIQKVNNKENIYRQGNTFTGIYPIILSGEICYLYVEAVLQGHTKYYYTSIPTLLGIITGAGVFILLLFKFTKNKIDYIEYLSHCLGEISKGDLSYQVDIVGEDELAQVAKDITYMESEIKRQIEAKLQTEKLKNELVTNVAHDLRTPLTSIIGYMGLIKNKQFKSQEEADKYIDIAYNKSESLKVLIEDLFELTKLHQKGAELNKESISLINLIQQLTEEFMPLASEKLIDMQMELNAKQAVIMADIPKMTRAFENLIENAIKYSQEGDTIYIELRELEETLFFAISNRCTNLSQEELDRLFDRFYRTDQSRSSAAGGSGLGLAIVKSIIERHEGVIRAKLKGEIVSFMIKLPKIKTSV
ncbi:HAMP domain-containing sensor histidine kinase [Cellulosilyticum sp. I15G10I2]|uniref:HAMP domain-containing sensor histidine kinase n=1 Tax=Cellulosilyticum sp. I15G10I2 TaxID=1892843 RepID=UPI00085CDD4E|nr:HAMP domain-containing sensor histidine kinase [Cellulosilyticum sp. I15G10I2]